MDQDSGAGSVCEVPSYDIRLFGTFTIVAANGEPVTPGARKARALLAYLILTGEPVPREWIAALLWSDRGDEQARASLRQTLYEMRAFVSGECPPMAAFDRTRIWLVAGSVMTDLDRMRLLGTTGEASALVAIVGDQPRDLLIDLDGVDAAFDDWLVVERVRRRDERRRILLAMGERALAGSDAAVALHLGNCLLAIDPIDEAGARLAMTAHHRSGDRDGTRQTFARLEMALRDDIGMAPSEETVAMHRDLMSAPPARPPDKPAAPSSRHSVDDVTGVEAARKFTAPAARRPYLRRATVAVTVAGVIAAAVGLWVWPSSGAEQRMLLVEPLRVAPGDGTAQTLKEGLSTDLARMIVGNDATLTVVDAGDQQSATRTRFAVFGNAQSSNGVLHANIKLVGDHDAILWSNSFSRPIGDVDALREQMAAAVADVTLCALGRHDPGALDLETMRLFLGACEQKHGDWEVSVKLLKQAVTRKPDFAHGWAMLAAATASVADESDDAMAAKLREQAGLYATRALALNRNEPEAYYARAEILPGLVNWHRRMQILAAGHAVDPTNSVVNSTIAGNLALVGRLHEAVDYARSAVQFDPFNPRELAWLVELLADDGQLYASAAVAQQAGQRFPLNRFILRSEFIAAALVGDPRRARALLADELSLGLEMDSAANWNQFIAARIDPAPARLDDAVRSIVASASDPQHGGLGSVVKLGVLQQVAAGYELIARTSLDSHTEVDTDQLFIPTMAAFRADPRFMDLAVRVKLVAIWLESGHWPDFCDRSLSYDCRMAAQKAFAHGG
ncbi:hypothetical protein KZX46_02450 (plasmid) [Polymorphobacter sp. PAMC 29334]|uniref:BTAD domain-containing putative transcriptional regulator n=1 Tax=Polymorphobacter sp. PAMC 29334 TaxID=2862331 RepID=UPI001C77A8A8|nr:BTAD domain-containing putative transcriptional regulator [Polymorphobacter sp. PAMC 29334]QYE33018.1 hypothetical protein KZX46_02450 [Polymorphobacter sp. PAMC 29334]